MEAHRQKRKKTSISEYFSTLNNSTDTEVCSTSESKCETITQNPLEQIEIRKTSDISITDESTDLPHVNTAQKREYEKIDQRFTQTTSTAVPEQDTLIREELEIKELEPTIFSNLSANLSKISDQQPQHKNIKRRVVTETLDTRYYESLQEANKSTSRCRSPPKYLQFNNLITDHSNTEMKRHQHQNKVIIPVNAAVLEARCKNRESIRDSSEKVDNPHDATHSAQYLRKLNKNHTSSTKKTTEKFETAEKLGSLQMEINVLTCLLYTSPSPTRPY